MENNKMLILIDQSRRLIEEKKYRECEAAISTGMFEHPHDAVPHNLMGLLLENKGEHAEAMKHFRAAYDLNPEYRPAVWNMECFGSYMMPHTCTYKEEECAETEKWEGGDSNVHNNSGM